jgi:hypothetical protein
MYSESIYAGVAVLIECRQEGGSLFHTPLTHGHLLRGEEAPV